MHVDALKIPLKQQTSSSTTNPKTIILHIDDLKMDNDSKEKNNEAYILKVNAADQYIEVIGGSSAGVFYGIQTLLSLKDDTGKLHN